MVASAPDTRHICFEGVVTVALPRQERSRVLITLPEPSREQPAPLDEFSAWLLARAGLEPANYRAASLARRVSACLRQLRVPSPQAARQLLERAPGLLPVALDAMLIGVSDFFRDPAVFGALESEVLPALLRQRTRLRVLSVGAAQGAELYSVAMLLEEQGVLDQCVLVGLDCRETATLRARRGIYEEAELAGVSAGRRERHFEPHAGGAQVGTKLRARTRWETGDALAYFADAPPDMLLFRNVAIYLEREAAFAAWVHLIRQIRPGGLLVTGKAEEPPRQLGLTRVGPCLFRKD